MSSQLFGTWLERTRELQINSFGTDPHALEGADLAEFVRWNTLASIAEVVEMLQEFQWKPWSKNLGAIKNRDALVDELVDVLHFIGNILISFKVSDEELNAAYLKKMRVNEIRQAQGYDTWAKLDEPCDPLPAPRDARGL